MEFSFRDNGFHGLKSQSGQGILEYILVLVVAVAIIMGGIYQLNDAFRTWGNNYFGEYLACLLETGELPIISGSPGDSGICNQLFEPFSFAKGRPLKKTEGSATGSSEKKSSSQGAGEGAGGGGRGSGRPGYVSMGRSGFSRGSGGAGSRFSLGSTKNKQGDTTNTGSTDISSAGGSSARGVSMQNRNSQRIVDNSFINEMGNSDSKRQKVTASKGSSGGDIKPKSRIPLKVKFKKDVVMPEDTPLTFSNFIRILIIAAIIIALLLFLGGQVLQIGKNMEGS